MERKVQVEITVTDEQLRDLLSSAFEGGSNYWYSDAEPIIPAGAKLMPFLDAAAREASKEYHWTQLLPTLAKSLGCGVRLKAEGAGVTKDDLYVLDSDAIDRGIQVMVKKYAMHFGNWMADSADAVTGDVFLQCCLFGETIFG